MKLANLSAAEAALQPFIPSVAQVTGRDITLQRMWPMMEILGHPEKQLNIIHIAGTSGKTSTAYYLAALLGSTGKKIGLHVSPHIDKITERFQINGQPISDELYCSELGIFLDIIHEHKLEPTYFELHIAFAYWLFVRHDVDYAVIETGMGGLHDGTNVAQNPNKLCVITDIGIDHTNYLGTTIPQIAFQKAGIIHPHNVVYMYTQSAEVMEVFIKKCREVSATLVATTETIQKQEAADILDHSMPLFQQRNWLLAYYVFRHVLERDNLSLPPATDIAKTQSLQIPARMDIKKLGEKTLVVDGAHNEQKMQAFVSSFQAKFSGKKASLLFSLKQGKDYSVIIDIILPIISSIIVTTFETSQDLPVVSMDPEVLARYLREHGAPNVTVQPDHHTAYHELLNSDEDILIVTGSFYLIYQIRNEEYLA